MGFGDLKSSAGLKALNSYLADRSYIEGFVPTAADCVVFGALSGAPSADHAHALRWFNHIKSFGNETNKFPGQKKKLVEYGGAAQGKAPAKKEEEDDDDFDPFASDDEDDAEQEAIKAKRVAEYNAKKASKGKVLIAKSSVLLDVKPWDDETNMDQLAGEVKAIAMDGLVWGASKFVEVGYGIRKLQILCIIEDDKVSVDDLRDKIESFEDYVQSTDIAAFNKI